MTTAIPTGETFSRSPTFIIDGGERENPCVETTPAADCCVEFLKDQGVDKVLVDDIGRRASNLLGEEEITVVTESSNPTPTSTDSNGGSFEQFLANKGKFLGYTALIIGSAWGITKLYHHWKD